jgi:hypothetical protein
MGAWTLGLQSATKCKNMGRATLEENIDDLKMIKL